MQKNIEGLESRDTILSQWHVGQSTSSNFTNKVVLIENDTIFFYFFCAQVITALVHAYKHAPIKETDNLIKSFLWGGQSLIDSEKASRLWNAGGISLPQVQNVCRAAYIKTLTRANSTGPSQLWAANILSELKDIGMEAVLHPQTNINLIRQRGTPEYIISLIEAWQNLQKALNPDWSKELTKDSPICFNQKLLGPTLRKSYKKVPLDTTHLRLQGVNTLAHFYTKGGRLISATKAREIGLKEIAQFEWQRVVKTLMLGKHALEGETRDLREERNNCLVLRFKTKLGSIEGSDITQKKIIRELAKSAKYQPNNTQLKFQELLELEEDDLSLAFSKIKQDHVSGLKREFQFKLLSGRVFTNKAYAKMGRKTSAKCTFCQEPKQNFSHLYITCEGVTKFRNTISRTWQGSEMTPKRWFLGTSITNDPRETCKNFIAKEINHYVFQTNWAGEELSLTAFKNRILAEEESEEEVANNTNNIFDFLVKWENIKQIIN